MIGDLCAIQYLTFEVIIWIPSRKLLIAVSQLKTRIYIFIINYFFAPLFANSSLSYYRTRLSLSLSFFFSLWYNFKRFYNVNCAKEINANGLRGIPNNSFYTKLIYILYICGEYYETVSLHDCQ